ncbi:lysosomal-associated transmembrane protein 4A [Lingula anatina]|uniref:Lysosomal-associated transmembrane protein 4A n=1 Tax=Lingula anatina TaxID=7574 RepID=A0A1S3IYZ4_LINAN|nr:lysosomal-associated transmembrane protein 4A [Lingula anatina]|eukprot:XP_013403422.1 lysosomal-associated transmembrane protein 4A [Lingula anatina]
MRTKVQPKNSSEYKCCFCCHVRTGTVILGILELIAQVFALMLLVLAFIHPEILQQFQGTDPTTNPVVSSTTPSPAVDFFEVQYDSKAVEPALDAFDYDMMDNLYWHQRKWTTDDLYIGMAVVLGIIFLTICLLYGALKGRPGYLLPFFAFQVFDFALNCLTFIGYITYMPDVQVYLRDQNFPDCLKEHLMNCDPQLLSIVVISIFVLSVSLKAYFLGVVWSCYKYLQAVDCANSVVAHYNDSEAEMLLPPKYEEAISQSENPPPPYQPAESA